MSVAQKKRTNVKKTIKLFIQNVWKLHELSKTIILNKNSQFILLFWQFFCRISNIKTKLSTIFHFITDEQNENFNQKMKQYLRVYVNYQQNDWSDWLSMIKYVSNALNFISIKLSSFFVNYKFKFRMSFKSIKMNDTARKRILKRKIISFHIKMKKIQLFAKEHFDQSWKKQNTQTRTEKKSQNINLKIKFDCWQKTSKLNDWSKNWMTNS